MFSTPYVFSQTYTLVTKVSMVFILACPEEWFGVMGRGELHKASLFLYKNPYLSTYIKKTFVKKSRNIYQHSINGPLSPHAMEKILDSQANILELGNRVKVLITQVSGHIESLTPEQVLIVTEAGSRLITQPDQLLLLDCPHPYRFRQHAHGYRSYCMKCLKYAN